MKSKIFVEDPIMENLRKTILLKELKPSSDIYLDLLNSIVGQQLSGKVADLIFDRFLSLFPQKYC